MFTGLVQSIGIIEKRDRDRLVIHCPDLVANIAIGDSVAVNGVCLTATYISDTNFVADVSPETLGRTNFGDRKLKYVNLETALAVGDKIGGHFVSGHIDGMGKFLKSHIWPVPWSVDCEETKSRCREVIKVTVGMSHQLVRLFGGCVQAERVVHVVVHREWH